MGGPITKAACCRKPKKPACCIPRPFPGASSVWSEGFDQFPPPDWVVNVVFNNGTISKPGPSLIGVKSFGAKFAYQNTRYPINPRVDDWALCCKVKQPVVSPVLDTEYFFGLVSGDATQTVTIGRTQTTYQITVGGVQYNTGVAYPNDDQFHVLGLAHYATDAMNSVRFTLDGAETIVVLGIALPNADLLTSLVASFDPPNNNSIFESLCLRYRKNSSIG